jgi:hypothetical protein
MEFYSATNKNESLSFSGKWMELESIILSKVRLRKPKIACTPSYVDCRPKTNAIIFLDIGHTQRTTHGRDREREGNQKLECG